MSLYESDGTQWHPIAGVGKGLQYHSGSYGPDNVGDWLSVTTNSDNPDNSSPFPAGYSFAFRSTSTGNGGFLFFNAGAHSSLGFSFLDAGDGGFSYIPQSINGSTAGVNFTANEAGGINLSTVSNASAERGNISLGAGVAILSSTWTQVAKAVEVCFDSGTTLGFFGASPVGQQTRPVTLTDVINLLVAFGLSA